MTRLERAFYSNPGLRQGGPAYRFGHKYLRHGDARIYAPIRMASQLESLMELYVCEPVFMKAEPLVDALMNRTISRKGYKRLVALITENALLTGQVDETADILRTLAVMWRRCPQRWLTWWG